MVMLKIFEKLVWSFNVSYKSTSSYTAKKYQGNVHIYQKGRV